jgi:peptidoglycan/LPS O-acetylase OafA/YrhL
MRSSPPDPKIPAHAFSSTTRSSFPRRERLDILTSLRFFAALHVVFYHYAGPLFRSLPWLQGTIETGYYAVSIFYVLSGFVLVYSYSDTEGNFRGNRTPFWIGRFARIYPAYLLGFLLCIPDVVLGIVRTHQPAEGAAKASIAAVAHLAMIQAWLPRLSPLWNYPGWSVSVEAFFYLCFPFLLARVSRYGTRQCLALMVISWMASVSIYISLWHWMPNIDQTPLWKNTFTYNPLLRAPTFVTGMAIGRLYLLRKSRLGNSAAPAIFAGIVCITAMGLSTLLPKNTLRDTVLAPAFAYVIYSFARNRSYVTRLFSVRPLVLLGDASYSIYILQWPVFFLSGLSAESLTAWTFASYILVLLMVSIFSFTYIEQPLRQAIRRRLSPSPP